MTDNEQEQIYSIALTMVPSIGYIGAERLVEGMRSATDVFHFREELAQRLSGVHERMSGALDCPSIIAHAEQELAFPQRDHIQCLAFHDGAYPSRLREREGAPIVLFCKGNADLNALHTINMVDTRYATDYSTQLCATFLRDLKALCPDVLVVSGLACGTNISVHRSALDNDLPTVGMLTYGLDRICPSLHRKIAAEMFDKDELLTEFSADTILDKHNLISRNRIVAGTCDAMIIVESAARGGSLIIAKLAEGHHRDCFVFPGRMTDEYLKECNQLIHDSKVSPLLSAEDSVEAVGWTLGSYPAKIENVQHSLLPELTEEEQKVTHTLEKQGNLQISTLVVETDIPIYKTSATLFELEIERTVRALAGRVYQLL